MRIPPRICVSLLAIGLLGAGTATATSLLSRTIRASVGPGGVLLDGPSYNPAMSSTGEVVVFDTAATNLGATDTNGAASDIVSFDLREGKVFVVTAGANGASSDPSVGGRNRTVAFVSEATNLVDGDTNGVADVFVRVGKGPFQRISAPLGGGQADGPSSAPDISADGRYVAFASSATNLVPDDHNGAEDVFVYDVVAHTLVRASVASNGIEGNERSGTPSISADGKYVSFESLASNLVEGDTDGRSDVFVRAIDAGRTDRVSVGAKGAQQNAAVIAPFRQYSDVSSGGRYVVFDSDASNLVHGDRNEDTDVFVRDRVKGTTKLVSVNNDGIQSDNDSFAPGISANGRWVGFESFGENLARGSAGGVDVFLRDLRLGTTSLITVNAAGQARGPERVQQLLQQPGVAASGKLVAFVSAAGNLSRNDTNGVEDVFLRLTTAPNGRFVTKVKARKGRLYARLAADDPRADRAVCRVDKGRWYACGLIALVPTDVGGGKHRLQARVGGPGMLYDGTPTSVRFRVEGGKPVGTLTSPRPGSKKVARPRTLRGTASDRGGTGVARVEVAVIELNKRGCFIYDGKRFVKKPNATCKRFSYHRARGTKHWRFVLGQKASGLVAVRLRITDGAGNRRTTRTQSFVTR